MCVSVLQKPERYKSDLQDGFQDAFVAFRLSALFLVHRFDGHFSIKFICVCLLIDRSAERKATFGDNIIVL